MKKLAGLVVLVILASCGGDQEKLVKIKTEFGDMTVLLYDETPKHKANFLELAESGKYDSTLFHRVIKGFMIQGGDIFNGDIQAENAEAKIDAEIVDKFYHKKGQLAAARQGDQINPEKKSSSCQFYIIQGRIWSNEELTTDQVLLNQGLVELINTGKYDALKEKFDSLQQLGLFENMFQLAMAQRELIETELGIDLSVEIEESKLNDYTTIGGTPHLDGEYTIFGMVVEGLEVVDRIASVPTNIDDSPGKAIFMTTEIVKMPKQEVTEKYGYTYPSK